MCSVSGQQKVWACTLVLPQQCRTYNILDDATRRSSYNTSSDHCDKSNHAHNSPGDLCNNF